MIINTVDREKDKSECKRKLRIINGRDYIISTKIEIPICGLIIDTDVLSWKEDKMQKLTPESYHDRRVLIFNELGH